MKSKLVLHGLSSFLIVALSFALTPVRSEVLPTAPQKVDGEPVLQTGLVKTDGTSSSKGKDNYLDEAIKDGAARWKSEKMPILVFVKPGTGLNGYKDNFDGILKQSFAQWSDVSGGKVAFKFTTDPSQASISCAWTDSNDTIDRSEEGLALPKVSDMGELQGVEILMLTDFPEQSEGTTDDHVRGICLHEVGHALGLDHSSQPGDVMFGGASSVAALSERDKKTLFSLYAAPDSFLTSHPMRFDKVTGNQLDPKIQQMNFNNQGIADAKAGNFSRAITNFEAALRLAPGDSSISTNLGTAYYVRANKEIISQDEPAAEKDFKKAVEYLSRGGRKALAAQLCDTLVFIARSHKREADALKYEGLKRSLQSMK